MRGINSVKVMVNKYRTLVYVNFDNGQSGTRESEAGTGKWTTNGLSAEEVAEAKKVALVNGKWTNYTAPRQATRSGYTGRSTSQWAEGPLTTARDEREVAAKMVTVRTSEE
jgi:hypothetical protein